MPTLRNLTILVFAIAAGIGLYLVLAGNSAGPWLLSLGVIGGLVASWPYWSLQIYPEFWEMWRDYFNCRWY